MIHLDPATLNNPMRSIGSAIDRKGHLPILSHCLLEAEDDTLTITANDTEIEVSWRVPLLKPVPQVHRVAIPATKFKDLCSLMPEGSVITLTQDGDKVKIKNGKGNYSLPSRSADDYPTFTDNKAFERPTGQAHKLTAAPLAQALEKTSYAAGRVDVRYYLNGVLIKTTRDQTELVSSDGHRLVRQHLPPMIADTENQSLILPNKAVAELQKLLNMEGKDSAVTFAATTNAATFGGENWTFSTKLIDARYPDFGKVLNQAMLEPCLAPVKAIKIAIQRMIALAEKHECRIHMQLEPGYLHIIQDTDPDSTERLEVAYTGEHKDIKYEARYMLEALSHIDTEKAEITLTQNLSAIVLREHEGDPGYLAVVMPIKT